VRSNLTSLFVLVRLVPHPNQIESNKTSHSEVRRLTARRSTGSTASRIRERHGNVCPVRWRLGLFSIDSLIQFGSIRVFSAPSDHRVRRIPSSSDWRVDAASMSERAQILAVDRAGIGFTTNFGFRCEAIPQHSALSK
jgi:hypothetical protein